MNRKSWDALRTVLGQNKKDDFDTWLELCALLDAWDDEAELPQAVALANKHLAQWTDEERSVPADWAERLLAGAPDPRFGIARHLELTNYKFGKVKLDVAALARCPALSGITRLTLWKSHIGDEGVAALAGSEYATALRALNLSENNVSDVGVAVLAGSSYLAGLAELYLIGNSITDRGARDLAGSARFPDLLALDLGKNHITSEGAVAIAASPNLRRLRSLGLAESQVGEVGALAILDSRAMPELRHLNLSKCSIPKRVIDDLLRHPRCAELETFWISESSLA